MNKIKIIKIDDVEYVRKDQLKELKPIGKEVIVRTYSAGVHVGEQITEWTGQNSIKLKNARRIYRWRGANTLNEISMNGVNRKDYTRISEPTQEIEILPIEIIKVAKDVDLSEIWND